MGLKTELKMMFARFVPQTEKRKQLNAFGFIGTLDYFTVIIEEKKDNY